VIEGEGRLKHCCGHSWDWEGQNVLNVKIYDETNCKKGIELAFEGRTLAVCEPLLRTHGLYEIKALISTQLGQAGDVAISSTSDGW
jgi:hypothetical protein